MVTVPECTYGLDVIAQIGWWRDKEHLNREQIHTRLRKGGVQISERQVDHLYARYQVLMGCAERLETERLQRVAKERGGLIISTDGLEPEGASEALWVVREVQEDLNLVEVLPDVPHQWCQPHYLGNATRPIYDRDSELKTSLRKTIRREIREGMGEVLSDPEKSDFSPSDRDRPGGRGTGPTGAS
jgi:hypothetical protein